MFVALHYPQAACRCLPAWFDGLHNPRRAKGDAGGGEGGTPVAGQAGDPVGEKGECRNRVSRRDHRQPAPLPHRRE